MDPLQGRKIPDNLQMDEDVMIQGEEYEESDYYDPGTEVPEMELKPIDGDKEKKKKIIMVSAIIAVIFIGVLLVCVMAMSGGSTGLSFSFGDGEEEVQAPTTMWVEWRGQSVEVPIDPETGQPIMPEFKYTDGEKEQLRIAGFTGDEIESFEQQMLEPIPIVEEAAAEREEWAEQFVAPYFDTASEEWKSVINTTWYGLEEVVSYDTESINYQNYTYSLNADYEKIKAYGHQLLIKIYLNSSGDYAFMITTPQRYAELPDSGNMVVSITYIQTGDGHKFITDIVETRVD